MSVENHQLWLCKNLKPFDYVHCYNHTMKPFTGFAYDYVVLGNNKQKRTLWLYRVCDEAIEYVSDHDSEIWTKRQ